MSDFCVSLYGEKFCDNMRHHHNVDFRVKSNFENGHIVKKRQPVKTSTNIVVPDGKNPLFPKPNFDAPSMFGTQEDHDKTHLLTTMKEAVKKNIEAADLNDYYEYNELTAREIEAARMTKASYINLREGTLAAQEYTTANLDGWKLDTSLTDEHTATFVKDGKVRIAYRGTQNMTDWKTNIKLGIGAEKSSEQIQAIESTYKRIVDKYGKRSIEFFTGHSKGGGQAIFMGDQHAIPTITQDPALTPKMIARTNPKVEHIIIRTPTDWVSGLTDGATFLKKNFTQKLLRPDKGDGILGSHDVELMTDFEYTPKGGQGDSLYKPNEKNKAYIAKNADLTLDQIAEKVGVSPGSTGYEKLRSLHNEVQPENYAAILRDAGYKVGDRTILDSVQELVSDKVVGAIEKKTGYLSKKANLLTNPKFLAENTAMLGTTYGAGEIARQITDDSDGQMALTATMTSAASALTKASGLTAMGSEILLPLYLSMEASTKATDGLVRALPVLDKDPTGMAKSSIEGGIAGATFSAASQTQAAAYTALTSSAPTTTAALEAGAEMTALGTEAATTEAFLGATALETAGVEMTAVGTEAAGAGLLETAGTLAVAGTAGGGPLDPLSDVAYAAAAAAVLAAGVTGAFKLFSHKNDPDARDFYVLRPHTDSRPDSIIGNDPEIIHLMNAFNNKRDYTPKAMGHIRHAIDDRVQTLIQSGQLAPYDYTPDVLKTSIKANTLDTSFKPFATRGYMPNADYDAIERVRLKHFEKQRQDLENAVVQHLATNREFTLSDDQTNMLKGNPQFYKQYTKVTGQEEPPKKINYETEAVLF
jgi:hypothetical protein